MNKGKERDDNRPDEKEPFFSASYGSLEERPGSQIGPYKLLRPLGEGGFGIVYLAEQRKPVKRQVALKIIKPGMDTKQVIARFEAERQALALLDHHNIAHVFDAGTTQHGRPYFVMENVKGVPITEYCDQERLSIEDRLRLFGQVCDAIQHAHQKGIIHRDIKPSNILVTIHENKPLPMVIDFGVAKAVAQRLTEKTLFTEQGQLIGTPEYMSPEQAEMTNQDIDTRSDIYSLGVLLYVLLTGVLPFDPSTLRKAAIAEIQRIIREEEPPLPSTRLRGLLGEESTQLAQRRRTDIRILERQLHGDLDWITLKAIDKDRTRRYQTAHAIAEEIQRHVNHEPVLAGPPRLSYKVKKFARRHQHFAAAAAVVVVSMMLGLIVSTALYVRAEQAGQQAQQAADKEAEARKVSEQAERTAQQQRAIAEAEAARASEQAEAFRRALYFNHIALARDSQESGDLRRAGELLLSCPSDLRGWEWFHLWGMSGHPELVLGQDYDLFFIKLVIDGKHIVAYCDDGLIKTWDAREGEELSSLEAYPRDYYDFPVSVRAVSDDGRRLALECPEDGSLRVWDRETHREELTLEGDPQSVWRVVFGPNSICIVSGPGRADGTMRVWDTANGQERRVITTDTTHIAPLDVSPNGKRVICRGRRAGQTTLGVWNLETGEKLMTLPRDSDSGPGVGAFSPDGKRIVSGDEEATVRVWDASTGAELMALPGHEPPLLGVEFSPNGTRIVSCAMNGVLKVWDAIDGKELKTLYEYAVAAYTDWISPAVFSPDGKRIIRGVSGTIRVWNLERELGVRTLGGHTGDILALAISPDGTCLFSGGADKVVQVWDVATGQTVMTLRGHQDTIICLALSPDGDQVATGSRDGTVKVWDTATGRERLSLRHPPEVTCIAFGPSGKQVASGAGTGSVRLWDVSTGQQMQTLPSRGGKTYCLVFCRDGRCLARGSHADIDILDTTTGILVRSFREHVQDIGGLAISPDGKRMVSGGSDRTIRLWDLETGAEVRTLYGHVKVVHSVAFSPDGERIVSGSGDGTVKVWDASSGFEVLTLDAGTDVRCVAFGPWNRRIVSGHSDGTIRIWEGATQEDIPALIVGPIRARDRSTGKMVAWWRFDETEGQTAADSSGNGHSGQLVGDPQWVAGRVGGALSFDGIDDYVDCGAHPAFHCIGSITVAAWIRVAAFDCAHAPVITKGDTAWRLQRLYVRDEIEFHVANWRKKPTMGVIGRRNVNDGRWHHVAGTYDGTKISLYVDGELDATHPVRPLDTMGTNNWPVYVGALGDPPVRCWRGVIDDIRVYNYALTHDEIRALIPPRLLALEPIPFDGTSIAARTTVLRWRSGEKAAQHDIYFGTDRVAVVCATRSSPEYVGRTSRAIEMLDLGNLALDSTYYWRVDETNDADPNGSWQGPVWRFTTLDHMVIDDFEGYSDDTAHKIAKSWRDGIGMRSAASETRSGRSTGARVGYAQPPTMETRSPHDGSQSVPYAFDNNKAGCLKYSEVSYVLTSLRNWQKGGLGSLSLWFKGRGPAGDFVQHTGGSFSMRGVGVDIWTNSDQFHFASKRVRGNGCISAQVLSVEGATSWAKAGVMIRETLAPGSKSAGVFITPGHGCVFQARLEASQYTTTDYFKVATDEQKAIKAPFWVKLERHSSIFNGFYSSDGTTWTPSRWNPQTIDMADQVYVGLALTGCAEGALCEAKFSDVEITGDISDDWEDRDIGVVGNEAEPMYVVVTDASGRTAVITHPDRSATQIPNWTEWIIDLDQFSQQGVDLTDVNELAIGFGDRQYPKPGGAGLMYFDDIRLYLARKLTYINFQAKANHKLAEDFQGVPGNNLAELPKGEQTFGGVKFHVANAFVQLGSKRVPGRPLTVEGIKVNKTFTELYIFHGTANSFEAEGTIIGYYILHYEDNTLKRIPIVLGEDVRDWWNDDDSTPATHGRVAWIGQNAARRRQNRMLRLYLTAWKNPHPDRKVISIDYVSTNTNAAPFCVAMTVGEADRAAVDD